MFLAALPVGYYYWVTYGISEPDIVYVLINYGALLVLFGSVWATIRLLWVVWPPLSRYFRVKRRLAGHSIGIRAHYLSDDCKEQYTKFEEKFRLL